VNKLVSEGRQNRDTLLDKITKDITGILDDPARIEYANRGIMRTLLRHLDLPDELVEQGQVPFPPQTPAEDAKSTVIRHYMALLTVHEALGQTEFYFRRYPFFGLPVSKTEHLRNVCEMYFDRIAQFRDRVKNITKAIQRAAGQHDPRFGQLIKALDKAFDWELRQRNAAHHKKRFEYDATDQLGLIDLLRSNPELAKVLPNSTTIYRSETRLWVQRVKRRAGELEQVLELVAGYILEMPMFGTESEAAND